MREPAVAELLAQVHEQFAGAPLSYGHGTDNAWDEAVALVLGVTGYPDDQGTMALPVDQLEHQRILDLARRRIETRQPLAYLLGKCQYLGLELLIEPGVIVPRSPIGGLLLDGIQPWLPAQVGRVLDLCAGSGCLGIVAAHVFPEAQVTLVELDPAAVTLAARNVAKHDLSGRVQIVQADVTQSLELGERFDLIIANPPYVDQADMATLPLEYQAEPRAALAAGGDGLSVIRRIFEQLPGWLAPGGLLVGEVGASAPALLRNFPRLPFVWPDLPHGGEGVFLLEAQALSSHTARQI